MFFIDAIYFQTVLKTFEDQASYIIHAYHFFPELKEENTTTETTTETTTVTTTIADGNEDNCGLGLVGCEPTGVDIDITAETTKTSTTMETAAVTTTEADGNEDNCEIGRASCRERV